MPEKNNHKGVTFYDLIRFITLKHLISSGSGYPEWLNDWLIKKGPA
jgi:hypothetical protein